MVVTPPAPSILASLVQQALAEDVGRGDITTQACVEPMVQGTAMLNARDPLVVSGLPVIAEVFSQIDLLVDIDPQVADGDFVDGGTTVAILNGPAASILIGERVALNFIQRMAGVATMTKRYVDAIPAGRKTRIADTRKTTPGLRALERYAVRCGGGHNHREDLSSAVLIKDNHIAAAGGLTEAVRRAREYAPHTCRIECEVDSEEHLEEALAAGVDIVMLDNFTDERVRNAVKLIDGRAIVEVSGGITLERIPILAELGADVISVGALTHSSPSCDLGLDWSG